MTEVELRKLDDEMFTAYMEHNVDAILSHCAGDVVMQDFGGPLVEGKDAVREYLNQQFESFSDEKGVQTRRIIGDDQIFAEVDWSGTHTGDLPMPDGTAIPATGKSFNSRVAYYARVNAAGEVAEVRAYPDIADVMGQLGLMGG